MNMSTDKAVSVRGLRLFFRFLICSLLLVGLAWPLWPTAIVDASPLPDGTGLFTDAGVQPDGGESKPYIARTRLVNVNFEMLNASMDAMPGSTSGGVGTVRLNLFEDADFMAVIDRVEEKPDIGFTWVGHVEGYEMSDVVLTVSGGDLMMGVVTVEDKNYQVKYVGGGLHAINEIDQSGYPADLPPVVPDLPPADESPAAAADVGITADDGSVIDVLVVYTDAASAAEGGDANIEALITAEEGLVNAGYINSDVIQRVNIVHIENVSYSESGFNWNTTLDRLTYTSDGYMDNVHTLRNAYFADVVVLIVSNTTYCGLAWMMDSGPDPGFAPYAFSVVSSACIGGYDSMAHEMGHNMGSHHDHANAGGSTIYPYSYGYQSPTEAFRTIMAYDCPGGCTRVRYWSNPGKTYGAEAMGVTNWADNHLSLNNTRVTVANWRDSPLDTPKPLTATVASQTQIDLEWEDNSTGEDGFKIERSTNGTTWSQIDTVGADVTTYSDTGALCSTTYYYRVRAYLGTSNSAYSNTDSDATLACTPPAAPSGLGASAISFGEISLWWTDNSNNEYGFRIERSLDGVGNWSEIATVGPNVDTYTDRTALPSTTYYYRVRAYNAAGSAVSNTASDTTDAGTVNFMGILLRIKAP